MALQKFITYISPELTGDAVFRSVGDADNASKTPGSTFYLYPGEYSQISGTFDDIAFIGLGDREDVVINGGVVLANASANTITFENLTLKGANGSFASGSNTVTKIGTNPITLKFRNVVMSNAAFGVNCQGQGATLVFRNVDAAQVDRLYMVGPGSNGYVYFTDGHLASTNSWCNTITGTSLVNVFATVFAAANGVGTIQNRRANV